MIVTEYSKYGGGILRKKITNAEKLKESNNSAIKQYRRHQWMCKLSKNRMIQYSFNKLKLSQNQKIMRDYQCRLKRVRFTIKQMNMQKKVLFRWYEHNMPTLFGDFKVMYDSVNRKIVKCYKRDTDKPNKNGTNTNNKQEQKNPDYSIADYVVLIACP